MKLVDTHCHIHSPEFFSSQEAEAALKAAVATGVDKIILIATSLEDSHRTIAFAREHPDRCRASIGIHPHEATKYTPAEIESQLSRLAELAAEPEVVAVGECGLDFYYNDKKMALSPQQQLLRGQLQIASDYQLPVSFHVREAFTEFWGVLEEYADIRGVLHSFTDREQHLQRALSQGLLIGVNGIATFTSHKWQRELLREMPLESIVLETDAPFLTPAPHHGTINSPKNVIYITDFMAELRGQSVEDIAKATTANAYKLFDLA